MRTLLIALALGLAWAVLCAHSIRTAHFTPQPQTGKKQCEPS
jgi:hypothetical protein